MTENVSGSVKRTGVKGARVGENTKFGPVGVIVGICRTSLLLAVGLGRKGKEGAIIARPLGVLYAVSTVSFCTSLLVPSSDKRPMRLNPAPARVCKVTTLGDPP